MCNKCSDPDYIIFHRPLWADDGEWQRMKTKVDRKFREAVADIGQDRTDLRPDDVIVDQLLARGGGVA